MKYSNEFKRMQQLAGIQLNEIKVNNPLDRSNYIDIEYPSGDYAGEIAGDEVTFLLIDDEIEDEYEGGFGYFTDEDILDHLGPNHFFTNLYNRIGGEFEGVGDELGITVNLNDLKLNFGEYIV